MPTIRQDCHITLSHAEIDGGAAFGFVLDTGGDELGAAISVEREIVSSGQVVVRFFFNILLADDLINPDGSQHEDSKAAMYAKLVQFLTKSKGIILETPVGVYSDVGAIGHAATEFHYGYVSIVSVQLNNAGVYYPPADSIAFNNSVWDGTLSWASSYWR